MKKLFSAVVIAAVILSLVGCGGIRVSDEEIKNAKLYNEINNNSYKDCLYDAFGDKEAVEKQLEKVWLPVKEKEVKAYVEELKKIYNFCKEKGILADTETVNRFVDKSVTQLKSDQSQSSYYKHLKNTLKEKKISFNEYVKLVKGQYRYIYNKGLLEQSFRNDGYNSKSKKSFEEQFKEYIESID